MAHVFVILPALNEAKALRRLIPAIDDALTGRPYRTIVVNDGSTDDTSVVIAVCAAKGPVEEVRHPINQGYAAALRSGYLHVLGANAAPDDVVIALDADETQGPEYIPALADALHGGMDAVTASYEMPGGGVTGVPWIRRLMSRTINAMFRLALPFPNVRTYTNGFRGYRVDALRRVHERFGDRFIEDPGFAGGAELFLKVAQSGTALGEVPFTLHYERRGGDSKIQLGRTIRGYLRLILRARGGFR